MKKITLLFGLVCSCCCLLFAQSDIYHFDWKKEKYAFGAGVTILGTAFLIDHNQELISFSEIEALNPTDISAFNRSAIDRYNLSSAKASDYFRDGAFFVPLTLLFSKKAKSELQHIGPMYLETLLINTSLTFITQSTASRVRPFVYNNNIPIEERRVKAARRSFYSGHVSHVAALSFFTASVFSDLYPDSKYKWAWWLGSASLPAITAYLRYDAGKHFPTDVLTGYAVGTIVGCLIPKLHKINNDKFKLTILPTGESLSLGLYVVL